MDCVESESLGLCFPGLADELVWHEAFGYLEASAKVVGVDAVLNAAGLPAPGAAEARLSGLEQGGDRVRRRRSRQDGRRMHRAKHLAKQIQKGPTGADQKVLLTSSTTSLA